MKVWYIKRLYVQVLGFHVVYLLFILFPTIFQKQTVTVYEGLEKNELVFEIDLFESHLQPFVIDMSMATESNLRDSLFENLNFILQTIDGLPIKDSLDEFEIRKKFAFKEKLLGILYSKDRNVRQTLPNDNYVGVSIISDDTSDIFQMFLNKTNVIGCSSNDAYRRNKVVCLKKYVNLVLKPTHFYIGTDLLTAIHAVSKQLAIFSNEDIVYFSNKLDFPVDPNNLKLNFSDNIEFLINNFPSQEYVKLQQSNFENPKVLGLQENENLRDKLDFLETNFIIFQNMISVLESRLAEIPDASLLRSIISEISENEDDINKVLNDLSLINSSLSIGNLENLRIKIDSFENQINTIITKLNSFPDMSLIENRFILLESVVNNKIDVVGATPHQDLNFLKTSFINFQNKISVLESRLNEIPNASLFRSIISEISENEDGLNKVLNDLSLINSSLSIGNLENLRNRIDFFEIKMNTIITKLNSFPDMSLLENRFVSLESAVSNRIDLVGATPHQDLNNFKETLFNLYTMSIEVIHLLKFSDSLPYFPSSHFIQDIVIEKRNNQIFVSWLNYKTKVSGKEFKPIPICNQNYCYTFANEMIKVNESWIFKDNCHSISYSTYFCQKSIESFDCEYADETCEKKNVLSLSIQPSIVRFLNASHLFVFSKSDFIINNDLYLKMTNYIISFNESTDITVVKKTYSLIKFAQQGKSQILSFKLENETISSTWMEWTKTALSLFFCGLILFLGVQMMFFLFLHIYWNKKL